MTTKVQSTNWFRDWWRLVNAEIYPRHSKSWYRKKQWIHTFRECRPGHLLLQQLVIFLSLDTVSSPLQDGQTSGGTHNCTWSGLNALKTCTTWQIKETQLPCKFSVQNLLYNSGTTHYPDWRLHNRVPVVWHLQPVEPRHGLLHRFPIFPRSWPHQKISKQWNTIELSTVIKLLIKTIIVNHPIEAICQLINPSIAGSY